MVMILLLTLTSQQYLLNSNKDIIKYYNNKMFNNKTQQKQ